MKKIFLFITFIALFSCDDGNFEIPSFEFNETVNSCGNYVLYRTNSTNTEALIVVLPSFDIENKEQTQSNLNLSAIRSITYRVFNGAIGSDYFCSNIPPIGPKVSKNWIATSGNIEIISEAVTVNNIITSYKHTVLISNLVLENNSEEIKHDSYHFGSFVTSI